MCNGTWTQGENQTAQTNSVEDLSKITALKMNQNMKDWISNVIGEETNLPLMSWLRDGRVLCLLANALSEDTCFKVRSKKQHKTFHSVESVSLFLKWCRETVGMNDWDLFTYAQLNETPDEKAVLRSLECLRQKIASNNCQTAAASAAAKDVEATEKVVESNRKKSFYSTLHPNSMHVKKPYKSSYSSSKTTKLRRKTSIPSKLPASKLKPFLTDNKTIQESSKSLVDSQIKEIIQENTAQENNDCDPDQRLTPKANAKKLDQFPDSNEIEVKKKRRNSKFGLSVRRMFGDKSASAETDNSSSAPSSVNSSPEKAIEENEVGKLRTSLLSCFGGKNVKKDLENKKHDEELPKILEKIEEVPPPPASKLLQFLQTVPRSVSAEMPTPNISKELTNDVELPVRSTIASMAISSLPHDRVSSNFKSENGGKTNKLKAFDPKTVKVEADGSLKLNSPIVTTTKGEKEASDITRKLMQSPVKPYDFPLVNRKNSYEVVVPSTMPLAEIERKQQKRSKNLLPTVSDVVVAKEPYLKLELTPESLGNEEDIKYGDNQKSSEEDKSKLTDFLKFYPPEKVTVASLTETITSSVVQKKSFTLDIPALEENQKSTYVTENHQYRKEEETEIEDSRQYDDEEEEIMMIERSTVVLSPHTLSKKVTEMSKSINALLSQQDPRLHRELVSPIIERENNELKIKNIKEEHRQEMIKQHEELVSNFQGEKAEMQLNLQEKDKKISTLEEETCNLRHLLGIALKTSEDLREQHKKQIENLQEEIKKLSLEREKVLENELKEGKKKEEYNLSLLKNHASSPTGSTPNGTPKNGTPKNGTPKSNRKEFTLTFTEGIIGMQLEKGTPFVTVKKCLENGYAIKCKQIQSGCSIIAIDGISVEGYSVDDLMIKLKSRPIEVTFREKKKRTLFNF